jgi:GNAT superfamily N-acetyltransferase
MHIREIVALDRVTLLEILRSTAVFTDDEVAAALMQIDHALTPEPRDYFVYVAEEEQGVVTGFLSIGPTPKQQGVFDLYWLAVAPVAQGKGIGQMLLRFAESWTRERGGDTILIETWDRDTFARTRRFYADCGYDELSRIKDFRRLQHDKIVFSKQLT